MADDDDDINPRMKCDIELDLGGPNDSTIRLWTADILRKLADRIEKGEFPDSDFYPVHDNTGKEVGQIYFDHYGEIIHD